MTEANAEMNENEVGTPLAIVFLVIIDFFILFVGVTLLIVSLTLYSNGDSLDVWNAFKTLPFIVLNIVGLLAVGQMKRWGADILIGLNLYQAAASIANQNFLFFQTILLIFHFIVLFRYRGQMISYGGGKPMAAKNLSRAND